MYIVNHNVCNDAMLRNSMKYALFLDDERFPSKGQYVFFKDVREDNIASFDGVVARDYYEAVAIVEKFGIPYFVQFDHDLGIGKTGDDFAKYLIERALDGDGFISGYDVHSQNSVGAKSIRDRLDRFIEHIRQSKQR